MVKNLSIEDYFPPPSRPQLSVKGPAHWWSNYTSFKLVEASSLALDEDVLLRRDIYGRWAAEEVFLTGGVGVAGEGEKGFFIFFLSLAAAAVAVAVSSHNPVSAADTEIYCIPPHPSPLSWLPNYIRHSLSRTRDASASDNFFLFVPDPLR